MGTLRVPLESHILILDGVNRLAAVESALKHAARAGGRGDPRTVLRRHRAARAEQMLSDIRRNGSRSARSQGILCDLRDETARITRELIGKSRRLHRHDGDRAEHDFQPIAQTLHAERDLSRH